jgi:DNA-binding LacI/PurR family transcriptional regulator
VSGEQSAPTIFDVADLASVSVSTVSRVINGRADVSRATRTRVEEAIGRLSFAPQVTAQRLAGRRSHTVAMLLPSSDAQRADHDLDLVLGAAEATSGRGYSFNVATDPLDEPRMRQLFRSGLVEGALLVPSTGEDWRVELAAREQLPCVLIGRRTPSTRCPGWTSTSRARWRDGRPPGDDRPPLDRLRRSLPRDARRRPRAATRLRRGHEQAVLRHGLELHHVASDLDPLAAGQAALHLVDSVDGLSAVVATHGPSALGMLRALRSRGLRVPEDVSVLTVATSRVAELSLPSLSGTDFPSAQLGCQAAEHAGPPARRPGARRRPEDGADPAARPLSVRETSAPLART